MYLMGHDLLALENHGIIEDIVKILYMGILTIINRYNPLPPNHVVSKAI